MKKLLLAATSLAVLALAACQPSETKTKDVETTTDTSAETALAATPPTFGSFGVDLTAMDTSVKPGDDFNEYVNGTWLKSFEIPADKSTYGAFTLLADESEEQVKEIIEETAEAQPPIDTLKGKIAAFYNAYMDTSAIEAAGLEPIKPYMEQVDAIETREDLAKIFAMTGYRAPFGGWVDVDSKQPDAYIFYITQAGLGLPDRSYYLDDTEKNLQLRDAYKGYLATMLGFAGYEDAEAEAEKVLALETGIAKAHWDRALGRNRDLTYNKLSRDELVALAGDFPVEVSLEALGLDGQQEFIVRQIEPTPEEIEAAGLTPDQLEKLGSGIKGLFEIAETADLDSWKAYLKAQFISGMAGVLPSDVDNASFDFYGKTLRGQPEQRARWKRAVDSTEGALGEAVGKVYVERHFKPEAKKAMTELVANLRVAMAENLDQLTWMSEDTKEAALEKLEKFTPKIGYPQNFETYDSLEVQPDNAFANAMAADEWQWKDSISQLGKPIDKDEWFMYPQTVNAYYSPNRNEIVFPAAILQPPFFDLYADPAVNYGAIGAVIGHEMGHGFDDQGAKSDGDGLMRDWWTPEDKEAFKALTSALVEQYNAFCPIDDGEDGKVCVNGNLTLGENIGDVGGLSMAYTAYKLSLNGKEAPVIDGFTGDQRFFMAWAQVWRSLYREEALRQRLATDPHSPPADRINGVVRNMDAWYAAFDVKEGDALYLPPEQRVHIW